MAGRRPARRPRAPGGPGPRDPARGGVPPLRPRDRQVRAPRVAAWLVRRGGRGTGPAVGPRLAVRSAVRPRPRPVRLRRPCSSGCTSPGSSCIPLDRRHQAYRMHRLLREVLNDVLERTDASAARRASTPGRPSGSSRRATSIKPSTMPSQQATWPRAERLVDVHTVAYQMRGHYTTVARWIDAFPDGHLAARPSLCLARRGRRPRRS